MIKTIIVVVVVVAVALGGWQLWTYWLKVQDEKAAKEQQAAAAVVDPNSLPGLPDGLQPSLDAAERGGPSALGNWLNTFGRRVQDPRKASIQLDYVLMITRDNPQQAKQIFADVKDRTLPNSPVWPRIHDLEKSYQ